MYKALVLLAALASCAFAASTSASFSLTYNGNVTLTNSTQQQTLAYRHVDAFFIDLDTQLGSVPFDFAGFFSDAVQVTAVGNAQSGTATLDAIADGFFTLSPININVLGTVYSARTYPQGFVAWFDSSASYTNSFNGAGSATAVLSGFGTLTASGAFIGSAFVQVDEINPSGSVVNTVDLSQVVYDQASSGVQTDSTGNIKYAWIANTATSVSNQAVFNFTAIHSAVRGKLSLGATVSPKSSELVFSISGWNYASSANSLRLTIASIVASSSFNGTLTSSITGAIASGSGPNQVYVQAQTVAQVNGQTTPVTVSIAGTATGSASVQTNAPFFTINNGNQQSISTSTLVQVAESFRANVGVANFTITFPAGSSSIIYDPSMGFESPQTNAAGLAQVSVLTIVVAALVALFGREL